MKFDRFVKVMLVLIALLLFFNCAKDLNPLSNSGGNTNNLSASRGNSGNLSANSGSSKNTASSNAVDENSSSSIFETSVEAATPPSFLQVGKSYTCYSPAGTSVARSFKVLEIQNTGWVKISAGEWLNPNACLSIESQ